MSVLLCGLEKIEWISGSSRLAAVIINVVAIVSSCVVSINDI